MPRERAQQPVTCHPSRARLPHGWEGRSSPPWSLDHPRGWPELRREAGTRGPPRAMSEPVCRSFAGRPARCSFSFQAFHQPVLCNDQVDGRQGDGRAEGREGMTPGIFAVSLPPCRAHGP
jgi:hypothetical protein